MVMHCQNESEKVVKIIKRNLFKSDISKKVSDIIILLKSLINTRILLHTTDGLNSLSAT